MLKTKREVFVGVSFNGVILNRCRCLGLKDYFELEIYGKKNE